MAVRAGAGVRLVGKGDLELGSGAQGPPQKESERHGRQLAHELESSEINTIFEFLLFTFADDPQATRFARDQLREHVARLSEGFPELYTGILSRRALRAAA